jgi:hypothetical protein
MVYSLTVFVLFQLAHIYLTNSIIVFVIPNSYADSVDNTRLTTRRLEAYNYAKDCSSIAVPINKPLRFEDIKWRLVPKNSIISMGSGRVAVEGFFRMSDSTIFIPEQFAYDRIVLSHESLHALGFDAHPMIPFEFPCNLNKK